jgi:hypothetical protein
MKPISPAGPDRPLSPESQGAPGGSPVELHIERLVLEGIPLGPGHAERVQAAVESELARLLADRGLAPGLAAGGARPSLSGGEMSPAPSSDPDGLGTGIAQAVFTGIGGGTYR